MDYIRSIPNIFRNSRRQTELILPFTYSVVLGTEADFASSSLCTNKAPFAVYGKAVGDKQPNADLNALKNLSMIYDLVLITPKDHVVYS
jgi:hypothetical protein